MLPYNQFNTTTLSPLVTSTIISGEDKLPSFLLDPTYNLRKMQNTVDMLYTGYNYRLALRQLESRGDTKTVELNNNKMWDIIKNRLWIDYSGPDESFKTTTGEGKDKKTTYNWKAGIKNTTGNVARIGGTVMSFIKDKETANNTINDYATSARKTFQQMAMSSGNPYLMAGAALSMLSDKIGGTASATKGLGLGNDIGNFAASAVPFLGFAGADMGKQFESDELKGSSMYAWNSTADGLFGGKILFGKGRAKELTETNNMQRSMATNILKDAKLDFIGALDPRYYMAAQNELNGGYDLVGRAKQGAILQFTKRTLSKKKYLIGGQIEQNPNGNFEIHLNRDRNLSEFKEGGKVNIIPEGALHKNKHHLEDIDEKFEDVTTKGIPVIVESEGGEVILQAEVERQEIIFRLEVTKLLENLAKEKTDEAAIKAGKLLVQEILYNTIDNTLEMI